MTEYETPEFLQDDEDEVHQRMLELLPDDLDKSEGSHIWDLTRPTAIEVAEFKEFTMNTALQMIFPQFATGEFLDYHGEARGIIRKDAVAATGILTVNGVEGTQINEGDLFATLASGEEDISMSYSADATCIIPESGTLDISITCTEGGVDGNVAADSIIIIETENDGILSCTNHSAFENGIDEEDDETYSERIIEYDQAKEMSFAGSIADYKRWANEVPGVGSCTIIPASDSSGLVTIVIVDANGNPASQEVCTAVYNYIMSPDDPDSRLAPINAMLSVVSPSALVVTITATVELVDSDITTVKSLFYEEIKKYLSVAKDDHEIRITQVGKTLGNVAGVYDYNNLTVNGDNVNLTFASNYTPTISLENITLTEGKV